MRAHIMFFRFNFLPLKTDFLFSPGPYILFHNTGFLGHSMVVGFYCMFSYHEFKIRVVTATH